MPCPNLRAVHRRQHRRQQSPGHSSELADDTVPRVQFLSRPTWFEAALFRFEVGGWVRDRGFLPRAGVGGGYLKGVFRRKSSSNPRPGRWMALEAPLDPTQRTAMELEIGEKEDGVNEPRQITELMNDLTELDEWPGGVPCWGRCRTTWCCDVRGGWWVGGWVGGWVFGGFSRLLGWVGGCENGVLCGFKWGGSAKKLSPGDGPTHALPPRLFFWGGASLSAGQRSAPPKKPRTRPSRAPCARGVHAPTTGATATPRTPAL
jgi:hypothetical protein